MLENTHGIAFPGKDNRKGSSNGQTQHRTYRGQRAARLAQWKTRQGAGEKSGEAKFAFTTIRIDDLPIYNQDVQDPIPPAVARMKSEIERADGLLFVTPEHNRSIPALLKNAIDWGSRPHGKNSFAGKIAAMSGTSPGALGTALAQQHLRQILGILGVLVMGGESYVTFKPGLVDDSGTVTDEGTRGFLQKFTDQFAGLLARTNPKD